MDAQPDPGLTPEQERLTQIMRAASSPADVVVAPAIWHDAFVMQEVCAHAGVSGASAYWTQAFYPNGRRVPRFKRVFPCMPGALTPPELIVGRMAMTRHDHQLWCSVAHHRVFGGLVDISIRPEYRGRPCPFDPDDDPDEPIGRARRRSVLRRRDVLDAWPRWEEMWRCAEEIGLDELVLSRNRVGPLCGLNEDKATAFVSMMEERGIIVGRQDATLYGTEKTVWTLVRSGPVLVEW